MTTTSVVMFTSVVMCSACLPARAALRQPLLRLRGGVKGLGEFGKVSRLMGDSRGHRRGTFVLGHVRSALAGTNIGHE